MDIDSTQEPGFEFRDANTIPPKFPYDYIKDSQAEVKLRIGDVVLGRYDNKAKVDEALLPRYKRKSGDDEDDNEEDNEDESVVEDDNEDAKNYEDATESI